MRTSDGVIRNVAVLVRDARTDALAVHVLDDHTALDEVEREILAAMAEDVALKVREMGAHAYLLFLEETLSNDLLITDRAEVAFSDIATCASELYERYVNTIPNIPKSR